MVEENSQREFRWGGIATLLWLLVIGVVTVVVTLAVGLGIGILEYLREPAASTPRTEGALLHYLNQSIFRNFAALTVVQGLSVLAMVWLLTRPREGLTRRRMLGLEPIPLRKWLLWTVGGLVVIAIVVEAPKLFVHVGDKESLVWLAWLKPVWLGILVLALVGPIAEEVLFRGFVLGGLAPTAVGPVGAIVVTSALWSVLHIQYDWLIIAIIFLYGIVLGFVRWKSRSLWPPIAVHCANNLASGMYYYLVMAGS